MRIIIVDDPTFTREGPGLIPTRDPDVETVREAHDTEALLRLVDPTPADMILLNLGLPGLGGLDVLEKIQETNVVTLTTHDDPAFQATSRAHCSRPW